MDKKSLIVFSSIMAILILVIFFVIGVSVGAGINEELILTKDTMPAWVSALATVCIAMLTIFLAKETWNLRSLQQKQISALHEEALRPNIDLYLESTKASFQFMDVHIENNGNGSARDITFLLCDISKNIKNGVGNKVIKKLQNLNMFSNGIASLGSGKRRSSFIFSFLELSENFGDSAFEIKFEVTINYKDVEGRSYESISILDFSEYFGISELGGGDPAHQTYKEIKKIREIFDGFKGGLSTQRLKVDIWNSKDRTEQEEQLMKHLESQRND